MPKMFQPISTWKLLMELQPQISVGAPNLTAGVTLMNSISGRIWFNRNFVAVPVSIWRHFWISRCGILKFVPGFVAIGFGFDFGAILNLMDLKLLGKKRRHRNGHFFLLFSPSYANQVKFIQIVFKSLVLFKFAVSTDTESENKQRNRNSILSLQLTVNWINY